MTKRRMVHESFFQSEGVAPWSMRQRLLVIGLIILADDQGRLRGNPFWLKAQIFPYDMIAPDDIAGDLAAIASSNDTIRLYQVDGRSYIQLIHWWDYQSLQWAKESDMPAPEGWTDKIRQMVYKPKRWVMTRNWPGSPDRLAYEVVEPLPDALPNESPNALGIINTNTNTNIIKELEAHFLSATALFPPSHNGQPYQEGWTEPLKHILSISDDLESAKGLIDRAISECREKELTIARPKSIVNIAGSIASKEKAIREPERVGGAY